MKLTKKILTMILTSVFLFTLVSCGNSDKEVEDNIPKEESNNKEDDKGNGFIGNVELPIVTMEIEGFGTIKAELYPEKAPNTVNNFISLINEGYYDGLTFHRIIDGFMNQGGCPDGIGTGGPGYSIEGEFSNNGFEQNDLVHEAGVLSMARAGDPNSAGSQFFIMAEAAPHLDGDYAAFGKVVEGMEIVTEINKVQTGGNDAPVEKVVIKSMTVDTKGAEYPEVERIK